MICAATSAGSSVGRSWTTVNGGAGVVGPGHRAGDLPADHGGGAGERAALLLHDVVGAARVGGDQLVGALGGRDDLGLRQRRIDVAGQQPRPDARPGEQERTRHDQRDEAAPPRCRPGLRHRRDRSRGPNPGRERGGAGACGTRITSVASVRTDDRRSSVPRPPPPASSARPSPRGPRPGPSRERRGGAGPPSDRRPTGCAPSADGSGSAGWAGRSPVMESSGT